MLDLTGRENSRVIALSGCQDNQTSADCSPADASKGSYGAFTTCFGNQNVIFFVSVSIDRSLRPKNENSGDMLTFCNFTKQNILGIELAD